MAYLWTRLKHEEVNNLKEQYGKRFPEFEKAGTLNFNGPFDEDHLQVLQLEEHGWFRERKPYNVFLSYVPSGIAPYITLTVIGEHDRTYFSEIDHCNRALAKVAHRLLKEQGIRIKTCYTARFRERKHPIPRKELSQRVQDLIMNMCNGH